MSEITNYQMLKAKRMTNNYLKSIVNEVGLDFEHFNMNYLNHQTFKTEQYNEKNNYGYKKLFTLTDNSDYLSLFICENDVFMHRFNFFYGGFELALVLNSNNVYNSLENGFLNREVLALETNDAVENFLKKHNINEEVNVSLVIKRYGSYKDSTKHVVHEEVLKDYKKLRDVIVYGLTKLKELELKVVRHDDIVTRDALMGLNLPQDFLPPFIKMSGFDIDSLKGSKRSIMWYTSDEDGNGFDMNIEKSNTHLISPYIKDYLVYLYYKNFNDINATEYHTFSKKMDVNSLMNDILEFIENDNTTNDKANLLFKELLENDEICNDYMLDCLYYAGDFDSHTQPTASFYEVMMNQNFSMDSDEIDTFKYEYAMEYTTMYELIIISIEVLNELIINGNYSVSN